jgi:hypothetical protein
LKFENWIKVNEMYNQLAVPLQIELLEGKKCWSKRTCRRVARWTAMRAGNVPAGGNGPVSFVSEQTVGKTKQKKSKQEDGHSSSPARLCTREQLQLRLSRSEAILLRPIHETASLTEQLTEKHR